MVEDPRTATGARRLRLAQPRMAPPIFDFRFSISDWRLIEPEGTKRRQNQGFGLRAPRRLLTRALLSFFDLFAVRVVSP